jgi:uncharacterized protein YegL
MPNLSATSPVTVVGSSEVAVSSSESVVASRDRRGGGREPLPSGQLSAGDHDDLLNPELYADYVGKYLQSAQVENIPFVDTRQVLTVAVQDESGRPAPFANVTLTCADGNSLSLTTLADGTAAFFPLLDRLGRQVRLSVGAGQRPRVVDLSGRVGGQRQVVTLPGAAVAVRRFDLAVVLDTTGSMGDEIEFLKNELRAIVRRLQDGHPGLDIRMALVAYRDEGDIFVTHSYGFTRSGEEMEQRLAAQSGDGGGDEPEAMDQALIRALALDWRPDAVRSLLLVADAPPHREYLARAWNAVEAARARRVQIVPVAASDTSDLAQYVMRAMAAATQSRYLFLTDDSGIGNGHAEPAIDCYLVTKLESLIGRVLDGQISGRRVEPREEEIIRSVGDYDHGRCVLPPRFTPQPVP